MLELNKQETLEVLSLLPDGPLKDKVQKYFDGEQRKADRRLESQRKQEAMDESGLCTFSEAWRGRCGKKGFPHCPEHAILRCVKCKAQATHSCAETSQFVCGEPLCDAHTHQSFIY